MAVQSPIGKGCSSSGLWDLSEEMEARFFATLCAWKHGMGELSGRLGGRASSAPAILVE